MRQQGTRPASSRPDYDDEPPPSVPGPTPADWAAYVGACLLRRKWSALAVFLAGSAVTAAYLALKKPVYHAEARVLAQRQQARPSGIGYEDVPTRSAWDMIHGRENLVAIVRSANLLADGEGSTAVRPPLLSFLRGRESHAGEAPIDTLVDILDKRLKVTSEEGTVSIELDWPDPQQAYDIVHAALQNFLEVRYLREVKAFDEVISALRGRAAELRDELEAAIEASKPTSQGEPRPVAAPVRQPSEEVVRLQSLLESKRRAIQDVEEFRRRRLADLQAQLDRTRNTLSEAHPTVIGLRKDIEAASRESPQIEALHEEERRIAKDLSEALARRAAVRAVRSEAAAAPAPPVRAQEDQRVTQARVQYEQTLSRVNAAQIDLDAARAAFKYRYAVVWPPSVPKEPVSPDPRKIVSAGLIASLLLAVLVAVTPALWTGRIVRRWQVEQLEIPVLGEIRRRG